jgi:hypothetical protein
VVKTLLLTSPGKRPKYGWNIDANVGLNSVNADEDVALVQLGYNMMFQHGVGSPEEQQIYSRVPLNSFCDGTPSDPLVQAILAHQRSRGGTQDGHVSMVSTDNGVYTSGSGSQHVFMLIAIVNNIHDEIPDDWPRIDKLGDRCPVPLRTAIARECAIPAR